MALNEQDVQIEVMRAAGLENDEILRLAELRKRVAEGSFADLTQEFKRSRFLKFLYERGRLREWSITPLDSKRLLGDGRRNY